MRVGIMSFAHMHAVSYVHCLRNNPTAELIGIADDDTARAKQYAADFNTHQFDSYEQLLGEKPDAVIICSENVHHMPMVQMATEAGAHVLIEKPVATSMEDGKKLLEAIDTAGVQSMTAFPVRFSPTVSEIKNLIDSDALGTIYGCNTTNQGQLPRRHREWFVDKDLAGGGAMMDHTVHVADILRWYMGCEAVEVYAQNNSILYRDENLEVDTGGIVMVTFENGVFATIDCSWSRPLYYPTWGNVKLEVVAENGLVTVDSFKQALTVYRHSTQKAGLVGWGSNADQALVDEFIDAIQQGRSPSVTAYDGYKAMEIALAAYRSTESGEPVKLPLE